MDFSRKHCDELEDGEVLDDEHIGRASSPTAASSTERAQYQPPVSLADFKCPLPDAVAAQIERLELHARGVLECARGGPEARAAAREYLQVLDGFVAAAPASRRIRCSGRLRNALLEACGAGDGPTRDELTWKRGKAAPPAFLQELVSLLLLHCSWLLAPEDGPAIAAVARALDVASMIRRAEQLLPTLPPNHRGGAIGARPIQHQSDSTESTASAASAALEPLSAEERAALQLELVLDLDHTCVHASAVRGDSRQVADDAHTFTLSNGPGQPMRYKLRTRDGLEAFLREVHGRLPPDGLLMAMSLDDPCSPYLMISFVRYARWRRSTCTPWARCRTCTR
jgi:hypothetical protein